MVLLWLRYKLSLRDLAEMFSQSSFEFTTRNHYALRKNASLLTYYIFQ